MAVIVQPNGAHFGHLGVELLTAFAQARGRGGHVVLIEPRVMANPALFALQPEGIEVRRWPAWTAPVVLLPERLTAWRAAMALSLRQGVDGIRDAAAEAIRWHLGHTAMPAAMREHLRQLKSWLGLRKGPSRAYIRKRETYFRRQLLRKPLRVSLPPDMSALAAARMRNAGVADDRPIALIHAREAGFKGSGREVHHKHSLVGSGVRDDSCRNSRIELYRQAIDLLLARGYCVVRLGDPSMPPLPWDDVIDLARASDDAGALQIHCLLRARLLIAGEAGPSAVALVTNTPVLTVNGTDPIGSYPVRRDGLLLLKTVVRRRDGHVVSPWEMLEEAYYERLRDVSAYEYVENTAAEIAAATRAMLARLDGRPDTPEQVAFREAATAAAAQLRNRFAYVRKWGTDGGFLGDGALLMPSGH